MPRMSCVDTLAFVEYGDVSGNFAKWVTAHVDLEPLGLSADELWEFRNSVLHMTNLSSRKIIAGKVSPIMPWVGGAGFTMPLTGSNAPKPFDLFGLIKAIGHGIVKWGEGYNTDRDKWLKFIEYYDTTISDSRVGKMSTAEAGSGQTDQQRAQAIAFAKAMQPRRPRRPAPLVRFVPAKRRH